MKKSLKELEGTKASIKTNAAEQKQQREGKGI